MPKKKYDGWAIKVRELQDNNRPFFILTHTVRDTRSEAIAYLEDSLGGKWKSLYRSGAYRAVKVKVEEVEDDDTK